MFIAQNIVFPEGHILLANRLTVIDFHPNYNPQRDGKDGSRLLCASRLDSHGRLAPTSE